MKKIFISLLAVAALAACTKSEVAYEAPGEIGFNVVAGNITKTAVDGNVYPVNLNMYVFAQTTDNTAPTADYINKGEFKYKQDVESTKCWGGANQAYYWPNTKNLHFAGYSKSGNVASATVAYDCTADKLTISSYTPGTGTDNDLMYFPSTKTKQADGYFGKTTDFVPVDMYHTCAWLSFYVKGDIVTGAAGTTYKVTDITITGVDDKADLTCTGTTISWANNTATDATASVLTSGSVGLSTEAKIAETTAGSTVLIPQTPGKLSLTYTYNSSTGSLITETVSGLDLALESVVKDADDTDEVTRTPWEPGKHYIYTITIKANEILIAPTPVDWTDGNFNVTVE